MVKAVFIMLLAAAAAWGQDKPVVYNKADGGDTPLDRALKQAYEGKYTVTDISLAAGYVSPKPLAGGLPRTARNADGDPIEGYVLVAYIVSAEGYARDPVVLNSSDEQLNETALDAMKEWRFTPGSLKDKPVATTAAQEFIFKIEKSGFETTNIVLYQPDDVLKKRLPGAGSLAAYIEKIQSAAGSMFANTHTPDTLQIVVAVRPGKKSRVWITSSAMDAKTLEPFRTNLEAIPPVDVQEGPVAFAICGTIAGATAESSEEIPMPAEWKEAVSKLPQPAQIPEAVLDAIWPSN